MHVFLAAAVIAGSYFLLLYTRAFNIGYVPMLWLLEVPLLAGLVLALVFKRFFLTNVAASLIVGFTFAMYVGLMGSLD